MGISNRLLFCQCTAYLLAFVLALFAAVPLGQDQHQLRGRCLLYGAGRWQRPNGSWSAGCAQAHCFRLLHWGPPSACRYSLFISIFSCAYSALQGFRSTYLLYRGFEESPFSEFVSMLLSCTIALLMLVASATVSDGLNIWCNSVTNKGNMTISCRDAQEEPLNLNEVPTLFYDHFGTAQFGLWCAWIVWIVLAILAFLKVSHGRSKDGFSVQYKETLLSQQSQGYFRGQVGSVFI
ncbi:transmembrane protein 179-like [Carcharodon carcharias]|uniref:transmembrane protein 179-like n=1 Tax=Carcharodon carcharias TaxID=13397 RepID=UPI001B7E63A4|nr:transmembrane protein 179-like [Carcharodon carcharias]